MIDKRLQILIMKHQELDNKVDALATKRFLTPRQRMNLRTWKVMRLRCRDGITALKREIIQNEMDSQKEG